MRLRSTYKLIFRLHSWKKSRVSMHECLPLPMHTHLDATPFLWGNHWNVFREGGASPNPGKRVWAPCKTDGPLVLHCWKVKVGQSCPILCDPMDCTVLDSPGHNARAGSFSLLQGIFPTQEWNRALPHCRQILYQLSHKGSPRILGWVAYPFSSRSSQPRNRTGVSCIAGGSFTNWAISEAQLHYARK